MNNKQTEAQAAVAGRPHYKVFEERRKYPRIELGAPVEAVLENGQRVKCLAYNVSPGGLQIRCSRAQAGILNPGGGAITEDRALEVEVSLDFPLKGGPRHCRARCKAFYFALVAADAVAFGLRFLSFRDDDREALFAFIQQSLAPITSGE